MEFVNTLIKNLPTFGDALLMTLELAAVAIVLALVLGIIFGLFTVSGFKTLEFLSAIYIDIIRGTPLLVQTFIIYYGLAQSLKPLGFSWSNIGGPFTAGVVALSLNAGAYMAEIIRGGIQSVDKGQMEAARSLGLPYFKAMRRVILPHVTTAVVRWWIRSRTLPSNVFANCTAPSTPTYSPTPAHRPTWPFSSPC